MKKSALMMAIGKEPAAEDDEDISEDVESDEDESDNDEDEALDTFLDDTQDIETRKAAFRAAVKACVGKGY